MNLLLESKHIDEDGTEYWFDDQDRSHRDGGPALIAPDGYKSWWIHGKLHREDGPAIIYADGSVGWYLNNIFLYFSQWLDAVNGFKEQNKSMIMKQLLNYVKNDNQLQIARLVKELEKHNLNWPELNVVKKYITDEFY